MRRRFLKLSTIAVLIAFIVLTASSASAEDKKGFLAITALTNVRIIDAVNVTAVENGVVLIAENAIRAVGSTKDIVIPKTAKRWDLTGMTVIPGLIDLHYHATLYHAGFGWDKTVDEPDALVALRAAQNLRTTLEAGVTTVRDTGGVREIPNALKQALLLGLIEGPRYYIAGRIITNTGGHAWRMAETADGTDQILRVIRNRFAEGADKCDFIKLTWNLPPGFSNEEVRTAIETAHKYGKKVAVHAFQPETIHACVEYGADTIEHGWGMDSKTIPLAVKNKTIIVPTMYIVAKSLVDEGSRGMLEGETYDKYIEQMKKYWEMILTHLKPYVAAGGTIALGTDCGCYPMLFSDAPNELMTYKELGLTPFQIIQAGTINGARAIGIDDMIGTLEKGKRADIVVLEGNPLEDLTALKRVKLVLLDGKVVVNAVKKSIMD